MRRIRRRLRGRSVLPKTQWNNAVILRTRFTTLWRSEIHTNRKIDAGLRYTISIKDSEGSMLLSAHASTVYAV
jgi:hypothetical protein